MTETELKRLRSLYHNMKYDILLTFKGKEINKKKIKGKIKDQFDLSEIRYGRFLNWNKNLLYVKMVILSSNYNI